MSKYPKSLPERSKAFLRGDLAHEFEGPDHKPSTSDLTMQEYADGWGVSLKEAQRRFTQHRMNNPIAYPQTKNINKASEITAAANEGMWSDFANNMSEGMQAVNALPAVVGYSAGVAAGWMGKKKSDQWRREDDAKEQLTPNGPTPPPPPPAPSPRK